MKGNKKSRNYGNAARQVLFPLGNDSANIILLLYFYYYYKQYLQKNHS